MTRPLPLPKEEFEAIYAKVPRLCVELVMVEPDGVVLTKRAIPPCKGQWHLPGGTVRWGELLEDTARRVALTETGVDVEIVKQIGIVQYEFEGYAHRPVGVIYLARPLGRAYRQDEHASDIRVCSGCVDSIQNVMRQHLEFLRAHGRDLEAFRQREAALQP